MKAPQSIRAWLRTAACVAIAASCSVLAHAQEPKDSDSVGVQAAREKWVKNKGYKVYYTKKFDLSDLPSYKPESKVKGTIRMWGSNYFTDSPLMDYWMEEFKKYQPDVKFDLHLKTTLHAVPGLIFGMSDIGPMGRQITWDELLSYQREKNHLPVGVVAVTGSYNVSGWNPPIGVYLNAKNPLSKLSLEQLDGIFGAQRTGAWRELTWDTKLGRGPEKNIRTWGQLGLTGEWADKPIHVYGYNLQFHFPQEIESRAFGGVSGKWNENLIEYDNQVQPDGSFKLAGQLMLEDLAKDPYGIVYCAGGNAWLTPEVKPIALSVKTGDPAYELTLENVRERTYPMYADVFFYIDKDPKKPVEPKVREFVRYILSREAQTQVNRDGKYLPLTAKVIEEQRKLLD